MAAILSSTANSRGATSLLNHFKLAYNNAVRGDRLSRGIAIRADHRSGFCQTLKSVDYRTRPTLLCRTRAAESASLATNANDSAQTNAEANGGEENSVFAAAAALDIRVGRVLKVWKHSDADALYVEEVDVGEPEPRIICSGLVKYVAQDELQDSQVVVLANLKPRNMRGVKSNGMLLAASDTAHENVELIRPPKGSVIGERVWFGCETPQNQQDPASPNQVQKKKLWELVQPHLKTSNDSVVLLREKPMRTSAGLVSCKSLKNANVA